MWARSWMKVDDLVTQNQESEQKISNKLITK